jgi:hypothetical protein
MNCCLEPWSEWVAMRRLGSIILLSSLFLALSFVYYGGFPEVKASPDVYPGDLVLTGNNVTIIEGGFEINGSIIVEENATLILRNAVLNFTQTMSYQFNITFLNPANGNPRFFAENATINSAYYQRIYLYGNSTASINKLTVGTTSRCIIETYDSSVMWITNSTLDYIYPDGNSTVNISHSVVSSTIITYENSNLNLLNCTTSVVIANDNSAVNASDSTIDEVRPGGTWINSFISGLKPGFVNSWSFELNCSVVGSQFSEFTLVNTEVGYWSFSFAGTSNITVSDSDLWDFRIERSSVASIKDSSLVGSLQSYGNAETWFVNSTATSYSINDASEAYLYWYLDVHVIDSIGQDVPSASVTATYPNASMAGSELTDSDGWATLTLMEKMMNATGEYPVGNYTVEVAYETHSNSTTVNMTSNQMITLMFSDYTAPTIESCNQVGDQKDYFELGETVHVTGGNYSPSTTYNFYIVVDVETWTDGMAIPERVPGSFVTVSSNMNGDIAPTAEWTTQTVGKFDIVVDVNGNGQYDPGIDALDDNDIEVTAGFSVIPELSSSLILTLFMIATLLMIAVPKSFIPKPRARKDVSPKGH